MENFIDFEEYNIPGRQLSLKLLKSIKMQGLSIF